MPLHRTSAVHESGLHPSAGERGVDLRPPLRGRRALARHHLHHAADRVRAVHRRALRPADHLHPLDRERVDGEEQVRTRQLHAVDVRLQIVGGEGAGAAHRADLRERAGDPQVPGDDPGDPRAEELLHAHQSLLRDLSAGDDRNRTRQPTLRRAGCRRSHHQDAVHQLGADRTLRQRRNRLATHGIDHGLSMSESESPEGGTDNDDIAGGADDHIQSGVAKDVVNDVPGGRPLTRDAHPPFTGDDVAAVGEAKRRALRDLAERRLDRDPREPDGHDAAEDVVPGRRANAHGVAAGDNPLLRRQRADRYQRRERAGEDANGANRTNDATPRGRAARPDHAPVSRRAAGGFVRPVEAPLPVNSTTPPRRT